MKKTILILAALLLVSEAWAEDVINPATTVNRVYVDNAALSIFLANHPSSCVWGLLASEEDSAYDRWISLFMMAYTNQPEVTVTYDSASCNIVSVAVGSISAP